MNKEVNTVTLTPSRDSQRVINVEFNIDTRKFRGKDVDFNNVVNDLFNSVRKELVEKITNAATVQDKLLEATRQ